MMNGVSLMMSKSCCPMYNRGLSNKINLIPRRLSNLHLQSVSPPLAITTRISKHSPLAITTTRMLKQYRVYSSSSAGKDTTGSRPPKASVAELGVAVLSFGIIGIIGLALVKALKVVGQSISTCDRYSLLIGIVIGLVVKGGFGDFFFSFATVPLVILATLLDKDIEKINKITK